MNRLAGQKAETLQEIDHGLKIAVEIPYREITFQNNSDKVLTISVHHYYWVGDIKPGETIIKKVPWYYTPWIIFRAQEPQGRVYFQEVFSSGTVQELENRDWKVVIPQLED